MSILHKTLLGTPSGKLGHLVFRRRRGKVFIYTTPVPYEQPYSEASTAKRNKFVFLRRAAACTGKDYLLKALWDASFLPGGIGYERQMKINSPVYRNDLDISKLKLVPAEDLLPVVMTESLLEEKVLTIVTGPITAGYEKISDYRISAHGMMLVYGEVENIFRYQFIPLTSLEQPFIEESAYSFDLTIKSNNLNLFNNKSFAVCLIIKDMNGIPVQYSVNLTTEV